MFDIVQGENETEGIIQIKNRIVDHLGLKKEEERGEEKARYSSHTLNKEHSLLARGRTMSRIHCFLFSSSLYAKRITPKLLRISLLVKPSVSLQPSVDSVRTSSHFFVVICNVIHHK